jgi:hypothetical protein
VRSLYRTSHLLQGPRYSPDAATEGYSGNTAYTGNTENPLSRPVPASLPPSPNILSVPPAVLELDNSVFNMLNDEFIFAQSPLVIPSGICALILPKRFCTVLPLSRTC